jgi:hypothetical protein
MQALDALVDQCRHEFPFTTGVVRDESNRSDRDWPWWRIAIEQTQELGTEKRRAIASVALNSTQAGEPGSFEAAWLVRIWDGVGEDTFRERNSRPLECADLTATQLKETMATLLSEANAAIERAIRARGF